MPLHSHISKSRLAATGLLAFAMSACGKGDDEQPPTAAPATREAQGLAHFRDQVLPILEEYCYDCHGDGMDKGELALDAFDSDSDLLAAHHIWSGVKQHVGIHVMPPEDKKAPTLEQRKIITDWIDDVVFWTDCENPDPGRVVLRRLNRTEYNNTVRDIFGVDFRPADDFPPDDSGYGYDNIADVLSLSPTLLEKYYAAAIQISGKALTAPPPPLRRQQAEPKDFAVRGQGRIEGNFTFFSSGGSATKSFDFPEKGRYRFKVEASGERAGSELPKMELRVGPHSHIFDVDAERPGRKQYEVTLQMDQGSHQLSLAFTNDFYDPQAPDPNRRDRNLAIGKVEIEGPLDAPPPPPSKFRQWAFDKPVPKDAKERLEYGSSIISKIGRRVFRRPLTADEVSRLAGFIAVAENEGDDFDSGLALAVEAMLISPHFLFRGGGVPTGKPVGRAVLIDELALASRLSYFLWSSAPDDQLLDLASAGKLREQLDSQIDRMIKSEKSYALAENFAGQWLQLRNMDLVSPDPKIFPTFDKKLASLMRRETELFFSNLIWENRSILEIISADYTFANARLAHHYGIPGIEGDEFRRISLEGTGRGGVLTQGSILTLTSNPNRTSPVKRGKFVLESILATPPPPAPPDVPEFEDDPDKKIEGTLRERFEVHRADPSCSGCHAMMDPLGFAFENFDAIGAWRTKEDDLPIDASGELVTGESFHNYAGLRVILSTGRSDQFLTSLTENLLTYALGRGLETFDRCAVREISAKTKADGHRFHALVKAIVHSVPFQNRRAE